MLSAARHWKIALCSLSTGNRVVPARRAASIIRAPAVTSASLLASATVLPSSIAAMVGIKPAQPTIAAMTQSASAVAASTSACSPPAARQFVPARAASSSGSRASSAITASEALVLRAASARPSTFLAAVSATTSNSPFAFSMRSSVDLPIEPVAPRMETRFTAALPPARGTSGSLPARVRQGGPRCRHGRAADCPNP